ncbi:MAG TPA: hypothetical protein VIM69_09395 [Opitutaceae bacterium]
MIPPELSVVPLTLTISLSLVATFVIFFIREQRRKGFGGWEGEALLPLTEERQRADKRVASHEEGPFAP